MINLTSFKIPKQVWKLIINKSAISCCSILAFQQLLEASATYWLVALMASIAEGTNFIPYIGLYLASLAFPYIPLCIGYILKISWKQKAQRAFTNAFVAANKDNIGEWSNKGVKEQKLSILTAEGPSTLHAFIDYLEN